MTQDLYSLENWWLNISLTSSLLRPGEEGVQENHKLIGEKVEGRGTSEGYYRDWEQKELTLLSPDTYLAFWLRLQGLVIPL